jgi:DNA repair protein RecO (recombination protein O)
MTAADIIEEGRSFRQQQQTMASEKATGLVIRTTDWSETSRIATIWTRDYGKVRVLAKGGRRLRSNFEVALDLLSVCSIVLLRKKPGGLDLLTEARVEERFSALRKDLAALYAAYYVAELLDIGTEERDPHPGLFDMALTTLRSLGRGQDDGRAVVAFEMTWLRELGYSPRLENCAVCAGAVSRQGLSFSPAAGGILCLGCAPSHRDRRPLSEAAWQVLRELAQERLAAATPLKPATRSEVRALIGQNISHVLGRRPRLLNYLR